MSRSMQQPYFLAKGSVSWKERLVLSLISWPFAYSSSVWAGEGQVLGTFDVQRAMARGGYQGTE